MLTRAALPPRSSRAVTTGICLTAVLATAVITKIAMTPSATPEPPAPPPPPRAAAPVVVPIAAPQLVVVQAPQPPPPPAPAPIEPPPPRATSPTVDGRCVLPADPSLVPPSCSWDHGFPAISADGKTIVTEYIPDDGGRGYPGVSIRFLEVGTSRLLRQLVVLDPDEYVEADDPKAAALRAKVERRAATAQRQLASGAYRALTRISTEGDLDVPATSGLRGEVDNDTVRLIDTASNSVLWQRRFDIDHEFPNLKHDPETDSCEPSHVSSMVLSWDAPTRTLLAQVSYGAGPCYCGDTVIDYVQHVR